MAKVQIKQMNLKILEESYPACYNVWVEYLENTPMESIDANAFLDSYSIPPMLYIQWRLKALEEKLTGKPHKLPYKLWRPHAYSQ